MSVGFNQDVERILEIWENAVRSAHNFLPENDLAFHKSLINEACISGQGITCARDNSGKILGFIGLDFEPADDGSSPRAGKIEMLFVDPEYQGKGVGRSLVDFARSKCNPLIVDIEEQYQGASLFYERCGFTAFSRSGLDGMGKPYPLLRMTALENPGGK